MPRKASLVRMRSWINNKRPILISVIASDVEMCRSTPHQLCQNPFLLNQARVSEPEVEPKTLSV